MPTGSASPPGPASLPRTCEQGKPIYLILDGDVGHTIGAILKEDFALRCELLVIDGISLRDFDYIDLGRIRLPSNTVPVTIKSLVFSEDPRLPSGQVHLHHHHHGHDHHRDHNHDHEHTHDHHGHHHSHR